jgi:multidrug resistance efflux pump
VARRHVSAGEYIKENTPLYTLVVANPLKYVGSVPERHAPALKIGQPVRLGVEAHPGREFTGTVLRVRPGERQGMWVEILDGVKAGESVATSNLPALFNGAPIAVGAR